LKPSAGKPATFLLPFVTSSVAVRLSEAIFSQCHSSEFLRMHFSSENSRYIRINQSQLREQGNVREGWVTLHLSSRKGNAQGTFSLLGDEELDVYRLCGALEQLRDLQWSQSDFDTSPLKSGRHYAKSSYKSLIFEEVMPLSEPSQWAQKILACIDPWESCFGIHAYATLGILNMGIFDSSGVSRWHTSRGGQIDSCFVNVHGKGSKIFYPFGEFLQDQWQERVRKNAPFFKALQRPPHVLKRAESRALFSPRAMSEILECAMAYSIPASGVDEQSSPLSDLYDGKIKWNPRVTIADCPETLGNPLFSETGQILQNGRLLVERGEAKPSKTVGPWRSARSLVLSPGSLPPENALSALGTGVLIGPLHYLNWSQPSKARFTGTSQFDSYWVEGGEIVSLLETIRFEDSLHRVLGECLEDLTQETEEHSLPSPTFSRSLYRTASSSVLVNSVKTASEQRL
jgi:predicted Zn-dependent protease